jgi:hypothetical protein
MGGGPNTSRAFDRRPPKQTGWQAGRAAGKESAPRAGAFGVAIDHQKMAKAVDRFSFSFVGDFLSFRAAGKKPGAASLKTKKHIIYATDTH